MQAVEASYQKEVFDEFIEPTVICNGTEPVATIGKNDSVIFFNFRPDRAREITRTLVDPEFNEFKTKKDLNLFFVCMTPYDETLPNVEIAFKKEQLKNTFGEVVSKHGLTQLRIAETEKYAHVTFFFNGGEEKQYPGEDRILVPSPKVETYDMKPEMSALEVTEKVLEAINSKKYDTIILNYANPDMVGHTGSLEAAIKAVREEKTISETIEGRTSKSQSMTASESPLAVPEGLLQKEQKKNLWGIIIAIILVLCIAGGIYWFMQSSSSKQPIRQSIPAATSTVKEMPNDSVTLQQQDTVSGSNLQTREPIQSQPAETPLQKQPTKPKSPSVQSAANQEIAKVTLADTVEYDIVGTKVNYTLQEGESLIKLALKFYGTKKLWPYIVRHNKNVIKDADRVPIGTTLRIPELAPKKQ